MSTAILPTGTVTFLFTDIEGSTRLLQELGQRYGEVLRDHHQLLRRAVEVNDGAVFGTEGDAVFAVFRTATAAVAAAVAGQRALAGHPWPDGVAMRVRMGVHTGEATIVGDNYVGLDIHRAARISAAGHGRQVLVSGSTLALAGDTLPPGVTTRDMGERRLKDLSRPERICQLVIDGLPSEFPPLRTLDATVNNLPTQLTTFVGRDRDVAAGRQMLEANRLLTLTGPGGTGKTRLSLQIAAEAADRFSHGMFFVPLDAIVDPALVPSAIVSALGITDATPRAPTDRVVDHLHDRTALLILDNFEQVIAAAPVVAEILRACQHVSILVTSRAALRISGEHEYPVPSLALPDRTLPMDAQALTRYESVALFIERAAAVRPEFRVTDENAAAVAEICARLDGLPLAIELAAARVKLLPPEAILARLGSTLGLLAGGARDLPQRQQTLRGAIAWSYELLDEPGRRLLWRSAIFLGGWELGHAEAVCGPADELGVDVLDGLASLVDQSLVRQVETSGEPRFTMLQTIREYAVERLAESGEQPEIARRHAVAFLALAEEAAPNLTGPDGRRWLDSIGREQDNLRAAVNWAITAGAAETAVRLGSAMWRFWQMRGFLREGAERMDAVLAMPALHERSALRRTALDAAAGVRYWMADLDAARALYEEALVIAREDGDPAGIAEALYNLSFVYSVDKKDVSKALVLTQEALAIYRALDDRPWLARALWALGNAHYFKGELEEAHGPLRESVVVFREVGDRFGLGWGLHTLGLTELRLGHVEAARRGWTEMLQIFSAADDVSGIGTGLSNFRTIALLDGDLVRAQRLAGASSAVVRRTGSNITDVIEWSEGRTEADLALDGATARQAWAEGQAMTIPEAVAYALEASPQPSAGTGPSRR